MALLAKNMCRAKEIGSLVGVCLKNQTLESGDEAVAAHDGHADAAELEKAAVGGFGHLCALSLQVDVVEIEEQSVVHHL